jgi:ribosome biogenesis GTPase
MPGDETMQGIVTTVQSVLCTVRVGDRTYQCQARRRLVDSDTGDSKPLAVGDVVQITPIDEETAVIERVLPRRTRLSRRSPQDPRQEHIIAANVDQVLIVAAVRKPDISLGIIDRYIIAAEMSNIEPVICLNKADLAEAPAEYEEPKDLYESMDRQVLITSARTGRGLDALREVLEDKTTVFAGHSGVGKSTLLNALQPALDLKTGSVYESGRHTTTWATLLPLDFGGYVVDTPGIREFALHDLEPQEVQQFFPQIWELSSDCGLPGCTHTHEPDCAVIDALEEERLPLVRYDSYLRIMETTEVEHVPRHTNVDEPEEQIKKEKRQTSRRKRKQDLRRQAERYLDGDWDEDEEDDWHW